MTMDPDATSDQPLLLNLEVEREEQQPRRCLPTFQSHSLSFMRGLLAAIRNWWNNSTDSKILDSPLSRRVALDWVVLVGYLLFFLLHLSSHIDKQQNLLLDICALLASSGILYCSSKSSLRTDFLIALVLALWGICSEYLLICNTSRFLDKAHNDEEHAQFLMAHVVGFKTMFLLAFFVVSFFAGLHSSACLMGMILHWLFQLSVLAILPMKSLIFIVSCFILGAMFEHFLARAVLLQESHRRLLENGSHGTCSVDITSGLVTDSCSRFVNLTGAGEALGVSLYGCVVSADHCRLEHLFDSVQRGEFTPQLVTWKTRCQDSMFDVKLIPMSVVSRTLQLCIQVQGEMRRLDPDAFNNETDGVDAPSIVDSTGGTLEVPQDAQNVLEGQSDGKNAYRLSSPSPDLMNPRLGIWHPEGSVSSQSSRQTVHSFWDAMRMLIGRDVRPESLIFQHISEIPEITRDYDSMAWQLLEEEDVHDPGELLNRFQERVQNDSPPPISAEQWARASFRVAERILAATVARGIERSQRREQAASSLCAAMLNRQPIEPLPVETVQLIAAAIGKAGQPPAPQDGSMIMLGFFHWFQSLHHELHPDEPDLSQEELNEHWNDFALRELAQ